MPKNNRHGQAAILSDVDIRKIRKSLISDKHKIFFDIAVFTGERWGAIAQLEVGDIYADASKIIPHNQITFRGCTRKKSPDGSQSTRQVPIHPTLKEKLRAHRPPPYGYLFPNPQGTNHISLRAADLFLRRAVEAAGLENRGISTHSTRRTFITQLYSKGVDIYVLKKLTGHKTLSSLLKYVEIPQNRVNQAINLLGV